MDVNANSQIYNINVDLIIPNRFQPRLTFDENALNELAASIKEHGIIQPLVLRKLNDKYEIIAGERRYKASILAGLSEVPAIIINLNDNQSAEVALVENVQRKNLSSIEVAKAYKNLLDKVLLTQEALSKKIGTSQSSIANKLRLLNLTSEVQEALIKEKISERHARSLLQVTDPFRQIQLLNKIISERLTVRQLDEIIKNGDNFLKETTSEVVSNSTLFDTLSNPVISEEPKENSEVITEEVTKVEVIPKEDLNKEIHTESESLEIESLDSSLDVNLNDNIFENNEVLPTNNLFNIPSYSSLEDEVTNMSMDADDLFNPFKALEEEEPEVLVNKTISEVKAEPEVVKERIFPDNIDSIKKAIRELKEEIEKAGYKIQLEDFDFEDLYQLIIKIDKQA